MKLLSIGQVAEMLGYSASTVRRLPIPYVRTSETAHRRYKQEDVERYIQSLGPCHSMPPYPQTNVRGAPGGSKALKAVSDEVKRYLKSNK